MQFDEDRTKGGRESSEIAGLEHGLATKRYTDHYSHSRSSSREIDSCFYYF